MKSKSDGHNDKSRANGHSSYWQHEGGQLNWEINGGNVDFSGIPSEIKKITWPKVAIIDSHGGQYANNL